MNYSHPKLKGLIPVLLTPLTKEGSICKAGTRKMVDFLIKKGAGGFWALGSAGEDVNLTIKEKITFSKLLSSHNAGRIPIILGCGGPAPNSIKYFIDEMSDDDIMAFHLLSFDFKRGEECTIRNIIDIADYSPKPIWLYSNPIRGKIITYPMMKELSKHENIRGIKIGGYDLMLMVQGMSLQNEHFQVVGAGSGQMLTMLQLGALAHTSSDGSFYPEIFTELYQAHLKGNIEKAREIQFSILDFTSLIPRTDNGESAAEEKYILKLRGICEEYVNPAYRLLTEDEKERLEKVCKEQGVIK